MVQAVVQGKLEQALIDAHTVCAIEGDTSPACAARWDIVEELHAALAHERAKMKTKSALLDYCSEYPDALECRIYDV